MLKHSVPRRLFFAMLPLMIFATCKKSISEDELIQGKIIYRSCATTAVQITDPKFYNLGQDSWQQDSTQPMFRNVFAVANPCELPQLDSGKLFSFKIISVAKQDCIICMMFDNPPQKKQFIKVIK